jgi:hypothetical protein
MTLGDTRSRSALRTAVVVLLALVAIVGLSSAAAETTHTHRTTAPGVYNGECPLAALAGLRVTGPVPESPLATFVMLVAASVAATPVAAFDVPVPLHTDPRAPPALLV